MRFGPESPATRRRTILKWSLLVVVVLVALAVDLLTKRLAEQNLVLGETTDILPFFSLQRTVNTGVAFGLLRGGGPLIIVANVIALLVVCFYVLLERRPILAGIAGGLIIGGSLGNLVQRLSGDGKVTDFMKLPYWPNFNMADVFLVVGIVMVFLGLVVETIRVYKAGRAETPAPR
jgi:signal peptidase II